MAITHVVFDFDGTCTQLADAQEDFLRVYRERLTEATDATFTARWDEARAAIAEASPEAGWASLSTVSSAPAHADPYILSGEIVAWLKRRYREAGTPEPRLDGGALYKAVYHEARQPAFRPEFKATLAALAALEVRLAFVSNSDTAEITARLGAELAGTAAEGKYEVHGNAAKYLVRELDWDQELPKGAARPFRKLPPTRTAKGLDRPIYLRRGSYYQALLKVWGSAPTPETTLVVGDIFELDLAMPIALGAKVMLVERAAPFSTCRYERVLTEKAGGKVVPDLAGLAAYVAKRQGKGKRGR